MACNRSMISHSLVAGCLRSFCRSACWYASRLSLSLAFLAHHSHVDLPGAGVQLCHNPVGGDQVPHQCIHHLRAVQPQRLVRRYDDSEPEGAAIACAKHTDECVVKSRGCSLRGITAFPGTAQQLCDRSTVLIRADIASQRARYTSSGWQSVEILVRSHVVAASPCLTRVARRI